MRKQTQQIDFEKIHWKYRYSHGGQLRNSRRGRNARPLTSKAPIHLVFKANKQVLQTGFRSYRRYFLIQKLLEIYSKKFFIKIEQITVQNDHLHLLIHASKRSQMQNFFRVFAGQIAQRFEQEGLVNFSPNQSSRKTMTDTPTYPHNPSPLTTKIKSATNKKLWKYRPFTRVVKSWRAYKIVRNYIQLNEKEALGVIPYQKQRLRGLSSTEWELLWA